MWRSTHLLPPRQALFLILNFPPPPLCQTCFTRLEICPRHNRGIYLTDFVQFHVERLYTLKITVPYDESSETSFSMTFDDPGYCNDCVYVKTLREGGFAQYSCAITFPALALEFHRKKPTILSHICYETMRLQLVNVSASAVVNLIFESGQSKELTKEQVQVLRHAASFNTTDAKPVNMIAAVESVINQTEATEKTKNLIRHQVSFLLMIHKPREIVPKVERDALRELKADKDIVIVPADKGRSTVVLDRTDYLQKTKNLLEDRQFYVPCEGNPVETLTREINATLLALETSGAITPTDRRMARAQEKVNIGMGLH
ncbi:hypothetical protein SprV_0702384600 [Sparganum proliferum]